MVKIILFRGPPAAGKTTMSDRVAHQLRLPVWRKDDVYDALAGYVDVDSARNQISFKVLVATMQSALKNHVDLVVDTGYNDLGEVLNLKRWVEEREGTLLSALGICSDEGIWAARLRARAVRPLPNQVLTDSAALKAYYNSQLLGTVRGELVLDTIEPVADLVARACTYIVRRHDPADGR